MKSRIATRLKAIGLLPSFLHFHGITFDLIRKKREFVSIATIETIGTIETRLEFSFNEQFQFPRCVNVS